MRASDTEEPEVDFEWVNTWQAARVAPSAPPLRTREAPVAEDSEYQAHCELLAEALLSPAPRIEPATPARLNTSGNEPAPLSDQEPIIARPSADQLMRDIAEIERARDALAGADSSTPKRRLEALMLIPSRTADSVPIAIAGVLALVMLTVFGAAAAMTKF